MDKINNKIIYMKKYKEFLITAEPFNSELLSGILWESNISGINEEVNCIKVFSDDLSLSLEELKERLQKLKDENLLFSFTIDRKSTRLNSSHLGISYAVFCLKKK